MRDVRSRAAAVLRHRLMAMQRKAQEKKHRPLAMKRRGKKKRDADDADDAADESAPVADVAGSTTAPRDSTISVSLSECATRLADEAAVVEHAESFVTLLRDARPLPATTAAVRTSSTTATTTHSELHQLVCHVTLRGGMRVASRSSTRAHCATFIDLWRQGYWLTSASKFGGHFLAYSGAWSFLECVTTKW
jgi:hypothetical protein